MKVGSLFSGIGGFDLGLERAGMEISWQVEIDSYCNKVLEKHWPNVRRYGDIKKIKEEELESVDLVCGGFPCQPFSVAGKRRGSDDDRYLWPDMFRIIRDVKPRWVFGENVAGIVRMALDEVLFDLENEVYEVRAFIIPACAVNAPHRRDRVWIVAHAEQSCGRRGFSEGLSNGQWGTPEEKSEGLQPEVREAYRSNVEQGSQDVADSKCLGRKERTKQAVQSIKQITKGQNIGNLCPKGITESDWWSTEPNVGRVAHGVPNRVDRLKCLGNTVVPQIIEIFGRAIIEVDATERNKRSVYRF